MNQESPATTKKILRKIKLNTRRQLILNLICLSPGYVHCTQKWVQSSYKLNDKEGISNSDMLGALEWLEDNNLIYFDGTTYIPTDYSSVLVDKNAEFKYWHWPTHRSMRREVLERKPGNTKREKKLFRAMGLKGKRIHNFKPLEWKKVPATPKRQSLEEQIKKYKESLV